MVAYLALSPKEDSSLFLWKDGSALSRDQLVKEVKVAVSKIGVDLKCYAGHSFQIRAAITGACVGIPPPPPQVHNPQMLGRWAYVRHIKTPRQQLTCISAQLVGQ